MKTNIKFNGIEMAGIKIGEVSVDLDFSIREAVAMKDLAIGTTMEVAELAPVFLEKVAKAVIAKDNLDREIKENDSLNRIGDFIILIKNARTVEEARNIANHACEHLTIKHHNVITIALAEKENELQATRMYSSDEIIELMKCIKRAKSIRALNQYHAELKKHVDVVFHSDIMPLLQRRQDELTAESREW